MIAALKAKQHRRSNESGSIIIEVAIFTPLLVLAILFIAWAGSQRSAEASTMASARAAARAAALAVTPDAATTAGEGAGTSATERSACSAIAITVDTSEWDQGWVSATAVCTLGSAASTFGTAPITRSWTEPVGQRGLVGG